VARDVLSPVFLRITPVACRITPRAPALLVTAARCPSFRHGQPGLAGDAGGQREMQPSQRGAGGQAPQIAFQPSQLVSPASSTSRRENVKFVIASI